MRKTHIAIGLAAVAAATLLSPATANAVSNPPGGGGADYGSSLSRGDTLYAGGYIQSPNFFSGKAMILQMQSDGNLVEYVADDAQGDGPWRVCWASNTYGSGADHAAYQQDGNFVVYTPSGAPVWASNTQWGAGSTVNINPYGRVYVGTTPITTTCG
ncbi:hypothetical protein [Streptacidiphilus sp. EB129]|uniref:hypothetical protein n=1 Tax=Streptacidiphilus sp. EB129 TaxID=3156262 RepID=UPI003517CD4F